MSGHSKWATIKRAKGAADAKRSSAFAKVSKDIIIATRIGQSGDMNFNPMLRVAVNKAKAVNLPNDRIEKAIKRGMGVLEEGEQIFEKIYEAYSSSGVPLIIDVETDNPNRSLTDIRTVVNKSGGKMVPEGSISWQFKEYGLLKANLKEGYNVANLDNLILNLLEIDGIEDVVAESENLPEILIYTLKEDLRSVNDGIKSKIEDLEVIEITLIKENQNRLDLSEDQEVKLNELIDQIKEIDDVSNVWF